MKTRFWDMSVYCRQTIENIPVKESVASRLLDRLEVAGNIQ